MRAILLSVALAIGLLTVAPANAQEIEGSTHIEDPADVHSTLPAAGFADIRAATVSWNLTGLQVDLEVEGPMSPSAAQYPLFTDYWLELTFRSERFRVATSHVNVLAPMDLGRPPQVWRSVDRQNWEPVQGESFALADLSWWAKWTALRTTNDAFPNPGESLELHSVRSYWDESSTSVHEGVDDPVVPISDEATFPEGTFIRVPGTISKIVASTPHPVRFSNGEATTFHWAVEVRNELPEPVDLAISSVAPAGIEPKHPAGLSLEPGETKAIQVYVPVPFGHQHGSELVVLVVLEGGGERAEYPLSVHYPATPQPAGHHPTLWLHGKVSNQNAGTSALGDGWMNAAREDPEATASLLLGLPATCPGEPNGSTAWWFPLKPDLRIGLDADVASQGLLRGTLEEQQARPAGRLYTSLELFEPATFRFHRDWNTPFEPDEWTASIEVPQALGPSSFPFEVPVLIRPELDRVEPSTQTNLALRIVMCTTTTDPGASLGTASTGGIAANAELHLPLFEFHDVVDLGPGTALLTTSEPNVRAAPGSLVTWNIDVVAPDGETVRLDIIGSSAEQARYEGPDSLSGTGAVTVGLQVPGDARTGDLLEFVLVAENPSDPTINGGIRLSVTVDPEAPRIQGTLDTEGRESPVNLEVLVAVLAAIFIARRRPPR